MSARNPEEIWQESVEEGSRRLNRGTLGLLSTGLAGGVDVMLGITALTVVSGALSVALPHEIAHVGGSLFFGIGFVLVVIGRSELFTENFLVPVATVLRGKARWPAVGRLWTWTTVGNLVGLLALSLVLSRSGLVPPETHDAAGDLADTYAERSMLPAFLSAIVAGIVMTLFTWVTHAAQLDISRVAIAMLLGFLLAAPSLNHAIVSFGEMTFGVLAGTPEAASWEDIAQNFGVAVAGNLLGGMFWVTLARLLQVRGEPA